MEESFEIELPSDEDGYVSFHCSACEQRFKLEAGEFQDRSTTLLYCPACGLNNDMETFYTPEAIEVAQKHMEHLADQMLHDLMKDLERSTRNNKIFKVNAGHAPIPKRVPQILEVTDMAIVQFSCCDSSAKLPNALALSGGYCPYCGMEK